MNRLYNVVANIVSALTGRNSPLLKLRAGAFRRICCAHTSTVVANDAQKDRLNGLGISRKMDCNEPPSDNAYNAATSAWGEEIISRFAHGRRVFVAGGINDDNDLRLVAGLANRHRDTRFIFVPHEITPEGLRRIKYELEGYTLLYSECDDKTDFTNVQVLVIDFLGALAYIYRYASWGYAGSGLTSLSYGLVETINRGTPVAFNHAAYRKVKSMQLINLGVCCKVRRLAELDAWFRQMKDNGDHLNAHKTSICQHK